MTEPAASPPPAQTTEGAPAAALPPPPPPPSRLCQPALFCTRSWLVLLATTLIALALDLGTKEWAFRSVADAPVTVSGEDVLAVGPVRLQTLIPPHKAITVVPGVLDLQLVLNAGAVFGAGQGKRWFFVLFTLIALGFAVGMFARWTDRRDRISHICIGLILAGGLGNLYDRLMFACVRDFLHPLPRMELPFGLSWPSGETAAWPYVSNVADAFLIVGIGVLMIRLWKGDKRSKEFTAEAPRTQR